MPITPVMSGTFTRDSALELAGVGGEISRSGHRYLVGIDRVGGFTMHEVTWGRHGAPRLASTYVPGDGWTVTRVGPDPDADDDDRDEISEFCDSCGDGITYRDMDEGYYNWCGDCGTYRCENCGSCDSGSDDDDEDYYGRDRRVHAWDYRPNTWRPKGNYPAEALLGLELEVGGRSRDIADIVRDFDDSEHHLYMKEDGSISGVEIVTHPATLRWSRDFDWDSLLRNLRQAGCEIDEGYGLHVHVSRNAFRRVGQRSTPHQMTWLMFMYRNATDLQRLARRYGSRWASFRTPEPGELKMKSQDIRSRDDRYVAVNCNNAKTYELRFFKSTLRTSEFMAALELADASVEYTRGIKTADILRSNALQWPDFISWADSTGNYPNLILENSK